MTHLTPQEAEHYAREFVPLWAPRRPEPTVKLSTHTKDDFDDDIVVRGLGSRSSSKKWLVIACAAALIVAVPLGISLLKSKEPVKSLPIAKPVATPAAEMPVRSIESSQSRVRVTVDPIEASLFLDGQPITSPFENSLPLNTQHQLVAKAEGYETKTMDFVVTEERVVRISLKRMEPPQPVAEEKRTVAKAKPVTPVAPEVATPKPPKAAKLQKAAERPRENKAPKKQSTPKQKLGAGFVTDNPY